MTGSISQGRGRAATTLADDVRAGLTSELPTLPTHCLYDDRGSALFVQITEQPEYYQTRTEEALLERIAERLVGICRPRELVELGSGVGRKIRMLLDAMRASDDLERCIQFDINPAYLQASVLRLAEEYPEAVVTGVHGDFQHDLDALGTGGNRLMLLLAGTMGNILPSRLPRFLERIAECLSPGDSFLVGVDSVKDTRVLDAAYNDAAGVTAAFNLNILSVVNRELNADFDPGAWEHVAFYDEENAWIEMRLRALRDQHVAIPECDLRLDFEQGDEIRTEISAKYTRETLAPLLAGTGLSITEWFEDDESLFALALLTRGADGPC
jgi:L-histidine N-alpha-methyltransferase